jgi:ubiquinone/menaquinone biosynthesis C-methylase UbiE
MKTPYTFLSKDYQNLHHFTSTDIKKFISIAKVKPGDFVLDAMSGRGAIAEELAKIKGINLNILDNSENQIGEAKKTIKNAKFYVGSALSLPFEDNYFDKVFVRNAVYEVSKKDQFRLYKEILRVLKKEGCFVNWTFKLNEKNQKTFQELVRKKDKLAGFEDLVKTRYFITKEEFEDEIKLAGFSSIDFYDLGITYRIITQDFLDIDFKGNPSKVEEWNQYIYSLKNKIPEIEIKNLGKEGFEIKVPALISVARK